MAFRQGSLPLVSATTVCIRLVDSRMHFYFWEGEKRDQILDFCRSGRATLVPPYHYANKESAYIRQYTLCVQPPTDSVHNLKTNADNDLLYSHLSFIYQLHKSG
jgi:hypothetical protein